MSVQQLAAFQTRFPEVRVMVCGAEWVYRVTGGALSTLIMLPGAHANGDVFYKIGLSLGDRLNVVTTTYPAWADSARLAAALARFMDALGLRSASICGSFLGGYIAQKFAHEYPDRVETLFLANTFCDAGPFRAAMPDVGQFAALPAAEVVEHHLKPLLAAPEMDALLAQQSPDLLKSRMLAVLLSKPVRRVPLAADRIVIVDADDDAIVSPSMRTQMRRQYAGAEHHQIPGGGHHPAVMRPDDFRDILAGRLMVPTTIVRSAKRSVRPVAE